MAGNLGAAIARRIGGRVFDYPVIAGAFVYLLPERPLPYGPLGHYYDPFYYPYYDPFWRPWPHPRRPYRW